MRLSSSASAVLDGDEVVCFELVGGVAGGVLAVWGALVQCALLGVGRAASDARVHEVTPARLDREAACVAAQALGGFGADRPGAFDARGRVLAEVHDAP